MAKKKTHSDDKTVPVKALNIEWWYPDNQPAIFANQMLVQFDGAEFHLSFFEVKPPLIVGSEEEKKELLEKLETIRAKCVARIVISKERMPAFLAALNEGLKHTPIVGSDNDDDIN